MLKIVLLTVITIQILDAVPLTLERNLLKNAGRLHKRSEQVNVEATSEAGRPKSSEHRSKRSSGTGNPQNSWMAVKEWYRSNVHENGKYLYYNRSGIWFSNGTFFRPYNDYSDKYYNSSGIWFRNGTFWRAYDNSKDADEGRNYTRSTDLDSKNKSQNNSNPDDDSKDKSLKTKSVNSDEDSKDKSLKTKSTESENRSKASKEESKESQKFDDSDESRRR